jgi:DNA-binding protein HU-beta
MYKTDLVRRVSKDTRLSQRIVADVLDSATRLIEQALREDQIVSFPGFGTFYSKERQEGQVRHITSGKMVTYPARRVAAFRVGEVLKRAVRGERRTGRGRPRRQEPVDE